MMSDFAGGICHQYPRPCIASHRLHLLWMRAVLNPDHWPFPDLGDRSSATFQCVREAKRQGDDHLRRIGVSSGREDRTASNEKSVYAMDSALCIHNPPSWVTLHTGRPSRIPIVW